MHTRDGFVEAVLAAPLGVTWLGVLEAGPADGHGGWQAAPPRSHPRAVAAAVDLVRALPFGRLMGAAVHAAVLEAGPWVGTAPASIAAAYASVERRVPIAEAIAARFLPELYAPIDRARQEWFSDGSPWWRSRVLFDDLDEVYGAGEFTTAGLWTATEPPAEALVDMVSAWELETGPVERWRMRARDDARVFEIHGPADWARLVTAHPRSARPHPGWELPGPNQRPTDLATLLDGRGRAAARTAVAAHLVPDWRSVAEAVDGVHLSWAGFITTEGRVVDLGDGAVTMLRYWFSERTLWLADVFTQPQPAPDPHIDLAAGGRHDPPLPAREHMTPDLMARLLGRSGEAAGISRSVPRRGWSA